MALQSYTQRELQMKSASDSLPSITEIFLRSIPINCCLLFLTNVFREAVKKKKKRRNKSKGISTGSGNKRPRSQY